MRTAQELNSLALRTRRMWNEDGYSPIDIFTIVNGWKDKKITIVRYPLSSRISGMCTKENEDIVICINSTTSYGRQRFALGDIWNQTVLQYATSDICVHLNIEATADDGDIYEIEFN